MTSVSPLASSTTEFAGRQTPWSNEAEQAVLGAMMLDQDAALKAAEVLDDTMFYREGHRLLFRSMLSLTERGDVIDPVTLRDELSRRGDLDRAGGMEYIAALIDVVPTAANVDYHAKIVRDKAVLRRLVEAATGIIQDVYEGHGTAGEVLDNAEHRVFQVAQFRRAEEFIRIKELIWPTMERIEQVQAGAGALTGVPSGFVDLDRYTAGFQRSELIILAARPSMGKTALALNIVQHAAIEHNTGVAFFSIEMSKDALVQRLLCSEGLVDAQRLRRGPLRDDDYPQLSRAPEQRGGEHRRPQLSDLRESGAIEQDADVVCFIYRQEFYDGPVDPKTNESIEGIAEVIVGKQRNGPTGTVKLHFKKEYTRFDNYTAREAPPPVEAGRV